MSYGPLLLKLEEQWDGMFLRYDPASFNKLAIGVQVRLGAGLFYLWVLLFSFLLLPYLPFQFMCLL